MWGLFAYPWLDTPAYRILGIKQESRNNYQAMPNNKIYNHAIPADQNLCNIRKHASKFTTDSSSITAHKQENKKIQSYTKIKQHVNGGCSGLNRGLICWEMKESSFEHYIYTYHGCKTFQTERLFQLSLHSNLQNCGIKKTSRSLVRNSSHPTIVQFQRKKEISNTTEAAAQLASAPLRLHRIKH